MDTISPRFAIRHPLGLALAWALITPLAQARGDGGDETLRHYLSRSKVVVAGEVATEPRAVDKEAGVAGYLFEFRVSQRLAGPDVGPAIGVRVVRHERAPEDAPARLEKGRRCILFLNPAGGGATPAWESADPWFGLQPHSDAMAAAIRRLSGGAAEGGVAAGPARGPARRGGGLEAEVMAARYDAGAKLLSLELQFHNRGERAVHLVVEDVAYLAKNPGRGGNRLDVRRGEDGLTFDLSVTAPTPDRVGMLREMGAFGMLPEAVAIEAGGIKHFTYAFQFPLALDPKASRAGTIAEPRGPTDVRLRFGYGNEPPGDFAGAKRRAGDTVESWHARLIDLWQTLLVTDPVRVDFPRDGPPRPRG